MDYQSHTVEATLHQTNVLPPLDKSPIAFLDGGGMVMPFEAGADMLPGVMYFFEREEVLAYMKAQDEQVAVRTVDPLPNLQQGGEAKPEQPDHVIIAEQAQRGRDLAAALMQMRDPAGKAIPSTVPGKL